MSATRWPDLSDAEYKIKRMAETKQTGTLIARWVSGNDERRLVAIGTHTRGYEDSYIVEERELDALGAARWALQYEFKKEDEYALMLIGAIKALASAIDCARERTPAEDLKHRTHEEQVRTNKPLPDRW